ncbi:MAG TPA: SRPBCC family protein [Nocardioidaceae bacterium]|nr:SRPBCC family protein [Nocardioidaceae bacterium]
MLDVSAQINAVRRRVGRRELESGEVHVVAVSQTYDTGMDDMWDACTNPERLPRWFLPVSGDLRLGGRYQLEGNAGGTIERCDPPKSFAVTWEYGESLSWVEVRLSAEPAGGTRFELEHIVPDDEHWAQFGPGATGVGWDLGIMALSLHLSTGERVDPKEVEAWSAGDRGKEFIRLSSRLWGEADLAAGADATEAQDKADRTAAAYTASPES